MTPREQAEAAWSPTTPFTSLEELEDVIRAHRGLPPVHLSAAEVDEALQREAKRFEQWRGGGGPVSSSGVGGPQ